MVCTYPKSQMMYQSDRACISKQINSLWHVGCEALLVPVGGHPFSCVTIYMGRMKGGYRGSGPVHCFDAVCLHNHDYGCKHHCEKYSSRQEHTEHKQNTHTQAKVPGRECFMLHPPRFSLFCLFFFLLSCYLGTTVI